MQESTNKLPLVPTKVRITKCGSRTWWYQNLIGREYLVRLGTSSSDHVLWDDYWNKAEIMRHIAQEDCEIIEPSYAKKG